MSLKFEMHGLDELEKQFDDLGKKADELNGAKVSFAELFNQLFMQEHTHFTSLTELLKSGGFSDDADEFLKIPPEVLDGLVSEKTDFDSWEDMKQEAANEYTIKKLGF